jgi:hypothetical protein
LTEANDAVKRKAFFIAPFALSGYGALGERT